MLIRHAREDDWADVVRIEQDNFSPEEVVPNTSQGGFIAVTSLSISKDFKGQGIGTALIAALKDLAIAQKRQGISLTCHDYLIAYYEMNGFTDEGESESNHGGSTWYNMVWENPETH